MDGSRGSAAQVRRAVADDIEAIERVRLAAFPAVFDAVMGVGRDDRKVAALVALRRCQPDPARGLVVAADAADTTGAVVGCTAVTVRGDDPGPIGARTWAVLRALGPVRTARFVVARQLVFLREAPAPGVAYVSDIAVLPAARGRGIGRSLVLAAQAYAEEAGASRFCALVGVDNTASLRLLAGLGYEASGEVLHPRRGRWMGEGRLVRLERPA